nr:hypothetical protein [uncultured Bacillus sp.]
MKENSPYLSLLKPVRRQLRMGVFIQEAQLFLALYGAWLICLFLLSHLFVIPFIFRYCILGAVVLLGYLLLRVWKKWPGYQAAAVLYNDFVEDDRVITAYSFFSKGGIVETLQMQDAVKHMKNKQQKILHRKKNLLKKRLLYISATLFSGAFLLFIMPNENSDLVKKKEEDIQLVSKTEKELKEKIKKEPNEAVKKKLKEAKEKVAQSESAEQALEELAKQAKKLELKELKEKEKQELLQNWQDTLKKSDLNQLAAKLNQMDLAKIEKELVKLNKQWEKLSEKQKIALQSYTQQEKQLSDKELEEMVQKIEEALQSKDTLEQLADAKGVLQSSGQALQSQLTANGAPPSKQAFSPGNSSQNSGSGTSNSENKQGNKSGNSASTQGNASGGAGNSAGSGTGNSSGAGGSGTGNNSGAGGSGSGASLGQGAREFLSIPEEVEGKEHRELDEGQLGAGQALSQTEGSGPVIKGTIRPYEEVYGEYEQSYRESAERYQLPANLENIVQNYFTNIDPDGE